MRLAGEVSPPRVRRIGMRLGLRLAENVAEILWSRRDRGAPPTEGRPGSCYRQAPDAKRRPPSTAGSDMDFGTCTNTVPGVIPPLPSSAVNSIT
jgi:hypothetical protein